MKRRMVLLFSMLLILAALVLPTKTVCAFGFCKTCGEQCRNDSFVYFSECRDNGGSIEYCDEQQENFNRNCQSIFCDGCAYLPL